MDSPLLHWTLSHEISTPSCRFKQHVAQRVCDFQIVLFDMPIHLKITLPLCNAYSISSTVWTSPEEAQWGDNNTNIQKMGRIKKKNRVDSHTHTHTQKQTNKQRRFQNEIQLQWHKTCQELGGCQIWVSKKMDKNVYKNRKPPSEIRRGQCTFCRWAG